MQHLFFIERYVDIRQYPRKHNYDMAQLNSSVCIGDLHANALKLLYFLIDQGTVELSKKDFESFVKIYLTAENVYNVQPEQMLQFNGIVARSTINPSIKLRFIGDVISDRGANDYFTFKIFEKIIKNGVNVVILLSNHDSDFIEAYENGQTFDCFRLQPIHAMSMQDLQILINRGLVQRQEVVNIYEQYYKHCIKPISYDLAENEIVIYSHAAIDITIIEAMAKRLKIEFDDSTALALSKTIDAINFIFTNDYVGKNKIHTLLETKQMLKGYQNDEINGIEFPFVFAVWNRNYHKLQRPEFYNGYSLIFCHGHDLGENSRNNIYNIDNMLGKIRGSYYEDVYRLLYFK